MPYITQARRLVLDPMIDAILEARLPKHDDPFLPEDRDDLRDGLTDGDVNYVFTRILAAKFTKDGYFDLERAAGLWTMCGEEFFRRAAAPYEDKKIIQNGDVYGEESKPVHIDYTVHMALCKIQRPTQDKALASALGFPVSVIRASLKRLADNGLSLSLDSEGMIMLTGKTYLGSGCTCSILDKHQGIVVSQECPVHADIRFCTDPCCMCHIFPAAVIRISQEEGDVSVRRDEAGETGKAAEHEKK